MRVTQQSGGNDKAEILENWISKLTRNRPDPAHFCKPQFISILPIYKFRYKFHFIKIKLAIPFHVNFN